MYGGKDCQRCVMLNNILVEKYSVYFKYCLPFGGKCLELDLSISVSVDNTPDLPLVELIKTCDLGFLKKSKSSIDLH